MAIFYSIGIFLYGLLIRAASLFNEKASLWVRGRKEVFTYLSEKVGKSDGPIWVHCASLGEFEQGRPLIEAIRARYPEKKILLTFFSPSGYEIRKNYQQADYVCYLPLDTASNARRFMDIVKPEKVFFIKYEFWYHFLTALKKAGVPAYLVSANFREGQLFFRWYGGWYRNMLHLFRHIFVQNERSALLLTSAGYNSFSVTGDTRFDRVYSIASQAKEDAVAQAFCKGSPVFIAGSTWPADEDILALYINQFKGNRKFIIAPHELDRPHISRLVSLLTCRTVCYSDCKAGVPEGVEVLIIDNIGILSSLYRYGDVGYIGGGFGKGIHNILEAATFGLPVLFGPNYEKFNEAKELVTEGGAFPIRDIESVKSVLEKLLTDPEALKTASATASGYIRKNLGATEKILSKTF